MNSSHLIRFGSHRFLNSRPFSDYLLEKQKTFGLDVRFDHPAKLADALKAGQLDLAFIPSVEYLNIPNGRIVPDICISSKGAVKTVLLVCRRELMEVKSIAVDERSRTSVALLRLILENRGVKSYDFYPAFPDIETMLKNYDAALVIGDAAFGAQGQGLETYDLSAEWFRLTQKPFVHALIVGAPHFEIDPELLKGLKQAKKLDSGKILKIAKEESGKIGISVNECVNYLKENIHYELGSKEIEGLKRFFEMLGESGFVKIKDRSLRFFEEK